jgi:putative membrane protein
MLRLTLAILHLLALAIGFRAVIARGSALHAPLSVESLRRAFRADSEWGIAALLWISTGLWRYLGGMEKLTSYYNHNTLFRAKMFLLVAILALEIWPMITLIRWRIALARRAAPDSFARASLARRISTISFVQAALVVLMVCAAAAMARGYGAR